MEAPPPWPANAEGSGGTLLQVCHPQRFIQVYGHKEVATGDRVSWNPKPCFHYFPSKGWIELKATATSPSFKQEYHYVCLSETRALIN